MSEGGPDTIVKVSSDSLFGSCTECGQSFQQVPQVTDFEVKINHYLDHGFELLHVGQETVRDDQDQPWQTTVAVLGK